MTATGKPAAVRDLLRYLRRPGPAIGLPSADEVATLVPSRSHGTMLLDHYAPEDVREALGRYGVVQRLAVRGFGEPEVELETAEPEHQVVRVRAVREGRSWLLGEAFLRAGEFETEAPFAEVLHGRRMRMLFIQWLRLQDPSRAFTAERPALPGQDHPGLGVGREVMAMFLGMADRLEFAGIVSCPEFAHNAVLYKRSFRFFDPAAQGRFEALATLVPRSRLAELAWAVERGRVLDGLTGEPLRWAREEMLCPTSALLREHFEAAAYHRRADEARQAAHYRLEPAE
jgi:hypothetical protein